MGKASSSSLRIDILPSPGTPNFVYNTGMPKGWSSERIPSHALADRRHINAAILPYNNGRTLPSKWEDAERWIISPVSRDSSFHAALLASQRRPKSKSGPLAPCYSIYSPIIPIRNSGNAAASSPSSTSMIVSTSGACRSETEPSMARSASLSFCSETLSLANAIPDVSRRDAATQMSPEGSTPSSSSSPLNGQVRDVRIDEHVTLSRKSKRNKSSKEADSRSTSWEISETAKYIARVRSEEAKITAWENLQKAKAEAAIRKLEVKLEKKRSSSMDKIINRLRSAQNRAKEMRKSVHGSQSDSVSGRSVGTSSFRRTWRISSLSGCLTCDAF